MITYAYSHVLLHALQNAAEKGELWQARYKYLNAGLLTASLGHVAVLGPCMGTHMCGALLPALVGTWGSAAVASAVGLYKGEASGGRTTGEGTAPGGGSSGGDKKE